MTNKQAIFLWQEGVQGGVVSESSDEGMSEYTYNGTRLWRMGNMISNVPMKIHYSQNITDAAKFLRDWADALEDKEPNTKKEQE